MLKSTGIKMQGLMGLGVVLLTACGTFSAPPEIRITPSSLTIEAGGAATTLEAAVSNGSGSVRWAITPNLGSLDSNSGMIVRYTPPTNVGKNEAVTITARLEGTTIQTSSRLVVLPPMSQGQMLTLNPSGANLSAGDRAVGFVVEGAKGVFSCSLEPNVGSCRVNGSMVEYTPPAQVDNLMNLTLSVGLEAGGPQVQASLSVAPRPSSPQISLGISPVAVTTRYGAAATRFSASVLNGSGTINWSLSPNLGTLSAVSGDTVNYTPPNLIASGPAEVTLIASLAGTSLQSNTTITVRPPTTAEVPTCQAYLSPATNESLAGYASRVSYAPGEQMELRVSSPGGTYNLLVYKEGQTSQLLLFQPQIVGQRYGIPAQPYANNINWPVSYGFTIPAYWSSGLYNAILMETASQRCFEVVFVVKPALSQPKAPIALMAADLTWQAYNPWGGASSYRCQLGETTCIHLGSSGSAQTPSTRYAPILTTQRPNPAAYLRREQTFDHGALGLLTLVRWLEAQGYSFDVISETDLHQTPGLLEGYRVLMLDRHSEYWTGPMYDALEQFLSRGGSLFNTGSNQVYWKTVLRGDQLEVRKDRLDHSFDNSRGGLWREVERPEARVLGAHFTATGADYNNRASYTVLLPDHWVLRGTNLAVGQTFGNTCSGWETDKLDPANRPAGLEVIARGNNTDPNRPGQAGADMTFYTHTGGGGIFSVGSLSFFNNDCISQPAATQIARNALEHLLGR